MRSLRFLTILFVLASGFAASACGGSGGAGGPRVSSPFVESDEKLFEDGVEFVADPRALADRWAEDWYRDTNERIERSDVIALVRVETLRTDVDPQNRRTYRLFARVDNTYKGKLHSDELTLLAPEGTVGFSTIDRDKQRVMQDPFVVFIKWYKRADGQVDAHFHLAVASDGVVEHVRARVDKDKPSTTRVIEVQPRG